MRIIAFLALTAPSIALAQTIDFDPLECVGLGIPTIDDVTGDPKLYTEDGYEFLENGGAFDFNRFCDGEARYPGSAHMFNNTVNGEIILTQTGGGAFTITQIDIAELNGASVANINFTGTQVGGTTVNTTFSLDGVFPTTQTFTFPPNFTNLTSLSWLQESPFHQFDNVVLGGGPSGFSAIVSTSCPNGGPGSISWAGATPSGNVAILGAASGGSTPVPGGPCAGTITGLGPMGLVAILGSDVNGTGSLTGQHQQTDCGTNIQLLDITTCDVSNIEIAQ